MGNVFIVRSKRVFTAERGVDVPRELAFAVELPVGASNAEGSGRIAHIGAPDDVIAACPAGTPVTDFGDRFICPGFHDAHLHFFHTAVYNSPYVLMHMGESEAELVARTREFAATLPPDAWVVTQGWRDYRWDPPVPPTKRSLDEAFPDRPCAMCSGDGHTLWLNSRALEALGVHRDSEPPAGGIYDRDENGELTGIIREAAAMELQPRLLEWLTQADFERAYTEQMARMAGQGITSICDMSLMPLPGCDFIREDIYEALDIFEEALARFGAPKQGRNTLEHLENLLADDLGRLAKLGVVASSQPCHITLDPGGPERDLGLERSRIMWPFATYERLGVTQAFGTDSPITPVTSMNVLYTAVTRQDPATHEPAGGWLPGERIPMAQAIRNYTFGSACAAGRERELGSLEAGKLADFVVLDHDLTACEADDIQATRVLATYVGGRRVFEA